MSKLIHELIFDFVNGKTKTFKFNTKQEALEFKAKSALSVLQEGPNIILAEDTSIFLKHVCSITYSSYESYESSED